MAEPSHFAIIGANITGLTLALALAKLNYRVSLIDQSKPSLPTGTPPTRTVALNPASEKLLTQLGLWETLGPQATPICAMHLWDEEAHTLDLSCESIGTTHLAHVLPNVAIQQELHRACQQQTQITQYLGKQPTRLDNTTQGVRIELDKKDTLAADFVVGADGQRSWVRAHTRLTGKHHDYQHTAIVTTIRTTTPHDYTARQAFLSTGPIGLLPLADPHTMSLIWSIDTPRATALVGMTDTAFLAKLNAALGKKINVTDLLSPRHSLPLTQHHARGYYEKRAVLIGDAAHHLHPLAGQGANLGFADIQALLTALMQYPNLNNLQALRAYQRQRRWANQLMLTTVKQIHHTFTRESWVQQTVRQYAMKQANRYHWLKKLAMHYAGGAD
jgi:2-octaprenylphenol hydroxylase